MITKLTTKQKRGIIEWRDKCLAIGYDTGPVEKKTVESVFSYFYDILKLPKPKFWYCQSPFQAQVIISLLENTNIGVNIGDSIDTNIGFNIRTNARVNLWNDIRDSVRTNIWDDVGADIWDSIKDSIEINLGDNIENNLKNNIEDSIRSIKDNIETNIWGNIEANIGIDIRDDIGKNIWTNIRVRTDVGNNVWFSIVDICEKNPKISTQFVSTFCWGQHDISWIAYYKYFTEYGLFLKDKNFEILDKWFDLAKSAGWCYIFENIVFVCEKPCEIHLNSRNQLHKEGGMALKYSDGWGLWMLNGVQVPQWLAKTRAEEIDPKRIYEIQNAQQRAEFVRKVGRERITKKTVEKVLDDKIILLNTPIQEDWPCHYRLLKLNYGNNIFRHALEMPNPSLPEMWHIEYVPTSVITVEQAMNFRLRRKEEDVDNISGVDYYVHGDRVLVPKGTIKTKRWPKLIA